MKRTTVVLGIVLVMTAVSLGLGWPDLVARVAYAVDSGQASAAREQLKHARDLSTAFQEVSKAVKPSVVSIQTLRRMGAPARVVPGPRTPSRDPMRDFFGDDFFDRFFGPNVPRGENVIRGGGTGVIVSEDGYILTNNHVVENMDQVTVTLSDERTFEAEVVGSDPKTDVAVIKIAAKDLAPAELGDSDALNVGEWVLAVGSPFGLSQTVTAGIISAKGRANVGLAEYQDFIQTDAAINPGNSGGPLLDLGGKVVGVNTAIISRSGGYMGVGLAIPINMARHVMDAIINEGKVVRGFLGVIIQDLTPDLAQSFGYDGEHGVLVSEVSEHGPAADAGLKTDDIIIEFDDKPARSMNQLRIDVAATKPGASVELKVFRGGDVRTLDVKIGELESESLATGKTEPTDDLGMSLQTLTPEAARQLELADTAGVLVTNVEPGGIAERSGLLKYDVIFMVGATPVEDLHGFHAALRDHDLDHGVRLKVKTRGSSRYVFLKR
jgi:serine protease Do